MSEQTGIKLNKGRMASIEMLRLLAMMMVVSLHFLAKGEILPRLTGEISPMGHTAWILEGFSIAAVDVYVLISAYFLVGTGFRCKRVVTLVLQVMWYTCLVPVILVAVGMLNIQDITFYNILQYVFPTNMLHYWFVSAYVLMFLFSPVLNAAVHAMTRQQLKWAIIILLIMESVSKTFIPVRLELDNLGYDAFWFMCVYLIAAYIRLYGIPYFEKTRKPVLKAWITYMLLCLGMYELTMLIRMAYAATGQFENFMESAYGYNHLLTIGAAVSLFYCFLKMDCQKTPAWNRMICAIAPYSFGVYLLHEHVNIRYNWPKWLGAEKCVSVMSFLGHYVVAIIVVMVVGLLADAIRAVIFKTIGKVLKNTKINQVLSYIDCQVNGKNG